MTRISFAKWTPATDDPQHPDPKYGYPAGTKRDLSEIEYIVAHDAWGYRAFLKAGHRYANPPKDSGRASWTLTNLTNGELWQHYELEAPAWTSGTREANIKGVAVENESLPDKTLPITDAQVETLARLYKELQTLCPNLKAPILRQGFQEHRIVTGGATTCPNDRIRWDDIAALLEEEDDMQTFKEGDRLYVVGNASPGAKPTKHWVIQRRTADALGINVGNVKEGDANQKSLKEGPPITTVA